MAMGFKIGNNRIFRIKNVCLGIKLTWGGLMLTDLHHQFD